jgi:hypothetical protein
MTGPTPKAALAAVHEHALSYPEAVEDHPWGDQDLFKDRVDESDRAVAPKTLVKQLDTA